MANTSILKAAKWALILSLWIVFGVLVALNSAGLSTRGSLRVGQVLGLMFTILYGVGCTVLTRHALNRSK